MICREDSKQVSQKVKNFERNLALKKALQDRSSNQIIYRAYCHHYKKLEYCAQAIHGQEKQTGIAF